jgi:hypothetical protein
LKFARQDIDAAQQLFSKQQNPRQRPIEIILYHCQQGAEKALKANIVQHKVLTKDLQIHALQILRQACTQWSVHFNNARIIKLPILFNRKILDKYLCGRDGCC